MDRLEKNEAESYTYYVGVGELYGDTVQTVLFKQTLSEDQLGSLFVSIGMLLVCRNFEDIEEIAEDNAINLTNISDLKCNIFKVISPKKYDAAMQSIEDNKIDWEDFLVNNGKEITVQCVFRLDPERNIVCGVE